LDSVRSIIRCLSEYPTFNGRARRSELWWFAISTAIGLVVFANLDNLFQSHFRDWSGSNHPLIWLYVFLAVLPLRFAGSRSLRDFVLPGALAFVPVSIVIIGYIGMLIAYDFPSYTSLEDLVWFLCVLAALVLTGIPHFIALLWPSKYTSDKYGPNPNEVSQ